MENIFLSLREAWRLIVSFDNEIYGIIALSLIVSVLSSALAGILGMPLGILLGSRDFAGRRAIIRVVQTLMGLPPVVAGLMVYMLLSRKGPMGSLGLLFTPSAMIAAQVLIVLPVITGLTAAAVKLKSQSVLETCKGMGLGRLKTMLVLVHECRYPVISAFMAGYGRAISEVGAVMLVGGNIQYETRVMTTAIVLETGKGNFERALALGVILLLLSFSINWFMQRFQEDS
ncbi:MAG: ABC transporter permease [Clostridia bacterium]|nr:ABC transporter permease [Clostridia bacterium]